MIVNVQVNAGPFSHQGANTAYHFIRAALERGHTVQRVFFYADGVYNGNDLTVPPQDECHSVARWSALAEQAGEEVELGDLELLLFLEPDDFQVLLSRGQFGHGDLKSLPQLLAIEADQRSADLDHAAFGRHTADGEAPLVLHLRRFDEV